MEDSEDVEDILDDIERKEIRMMAAQRGAGDRKKSSLIMIGSAVAGAVLGDVLIGREYVLEGDILEGYPSYYAGTEEHFYVEAAGQLFCEAF